MIPREVLNNLIKLKREQSQLHDDFLRELEAMSQELQNKYFARMRHVAEEIQRLEGLSHKVSKVYLFQQRKEKV